jgi:hypothetical protein
LLTIGVGATISGGGSKTGRSAARPVVVISATAAVEIRKRFIVPSYLSGLANMG